MILRCLVPTLTICYATLCYAMLRYAMLRYATLCYATLCYASPLITFFCTTLFGTVSVSISVLQHGHWMKDLMPLCLAHDPMQSAQKLWSHPVFTSCAGFNSSKHTLHVMGSASGAAFAFFSLGLQTTSVLSTFFSPAAVAAVTAVCLCW